MLRGCLCLSVLLFAAAGGPRELPQGAAQPAFVALDVWVDAGARPLAAWQLELVCATGKLVGVEGGEVAAFRDAPRYDPAALQGGRVILAALAAGQEIPTGRVRVAAVHVMEPGGKPGEYALRGVVAASTDGEHIAVDAVVRPHGDKR